MKYKIFIGVRFAENLSDSEWDETYDEIENLSNYFQIVLNDNQVIKKIDFQFAKHPRSIFKVKNHFEWISTDKVLIVQFNVPKKYDPYFVISVFEKRLRDLVISISIAKKGGINIGGKPIVFLENSYCCTLEPFIHSLDLAIQISTSLNWPLIKMIDLKSTINWLAQFQEETDSISNSSIGRALNAYSYLFSTRGGSDDGAYLFWTMVGIEAIFAEGSSNIMHQINLKTQTLLGKRIDNKKRFNAMYDFRSRFVHGDLDLNNKYYINDRSSEINKFWTDLFDNEHIAMSILIATFQELILRNSISLEFDYILKE